jgi:hypothetical protein
LIDDRIARVLEGKGSLVRRVGIEGAKLSLNSSRKQTKQGHHTQLASQDVDAPPDLQEIIDSWPALSTEIRAAVLAVIKSAKGTTKT